MYLSTQPPSGSSRDAIIEEFERVNGGILEPVEHFLRHCDSQRQASGRVQPQNISSLMQFTEQNHPEFAKLMTNDKLGRFLEALRGFRDLVFITSSRPKANQPKATHYNIRTMAIETVSHLQEIVDSDATLTPAQSANIIRILADHGEYADFPVADAKPIPDGVLGKVMMDTFQKLATEHPAITARIFNESIGQFGYNDHFKRDDIMEQIRRATAI